MARTAPVPNLPPIPGMCPGIAAQGGGGDGGGGSGKGAGNGNGDGGGDGENGSGSAEGDGKGGACAAGAGSCTNCPSKAAAGDPVDVTTGKVLTIPKVDLELPGTFNLKVLRSYTSARRRLDLGMGMGWQHSLGWRLTERRRELEIVTGDGRVLRLPKPIDGGEEHSGQWGVIRRGDLYVVRPGTDFLHEFTRTEDEADGLCLLTRIQYKNRGAIELDYEGTRLASATDTVGRRIDFPVAQDGKHVGGIQVSDPHGRTIYFAGYDYDADDNLIASRDANGAVLRYQYDTEHRLTALEYPNGTTARFRYDENSRCIETWCDGPTIAPALGADTAPTLRDGSKAKGVFHCRFEFIDDYTEVTDSVRILRYFGSSDDQISKAVSPSGGVTTRTFDDNGNVTSLTDPTGATWISEYDSRGDLIREIDPEGAEFRLERDMLGDEVRFTDPAGAVTEIGRDLLGDVDWVKDPLGGFESFVRDPRGQLVQYTDKRGGLYRNFYDGHSNLIAYQFPTGSTYHYQYDWWGRLVSETDPLGASKSYVYSAGGQVVSETDEQGRVRLTDYDLMGNVTREVEPDGAVTQFDYGALNWLYQVTDARGAIVRVEYNREGWATAYVNEVGERHVFDYRPDGLPAAETNFIGKKLQFGYDGFGRVTSTKDVRGRFEQTLSPVGRLLEQIAPDGAERHLDYDVCGHLTAFREGVVRVDWERDALGRVTREVQTIEGRSYTVQSRHNPAGDRIGVETSLGLQAEYRRSTTGALQELWVGNECALAVQRNAIGLPSETKLRDGGKVVQLFDASRRLRRRRVIPATSASAVSTGAPEWIGWEQGSFETAYDYTPTDEVSRVTASNGRLVEYEYDLRHALRSRTLQSGTEGSPTERFTYDPAGTRYGEGTPQVLGQGSQLLECNNLTYDYDARGYLNEKRSVDANGKVHRTVYTFSDFGMLQGVALPDGTKVAYTYDVFARRMSKRVTKDRVVVSHTHYIWDLVSMTHEVNVLTGATRMYLYEDNDLVTPCAHKDSGGDWVYYIHDVNGAPDIFVDGAGNVLGQRNVAAFGKIQTADNVSFVNPFRFRGQLEDPETGLFYNRYRYYDPEIGRYISPDPIGVEGGLNLYAYGPNPIGWADPMGWKGHALKVTSSGGSPVKSEYKSGWGKQDPKCPKVLETQTRAHTEQKFAHDLMKAHAKDKDSVAGKTFGLKGQLPPCPNCHSAMMKAAETTGSKIEYGWGKNKMTYDGTGKGGVKVSGSAGQAEKLEKAYGHTKVGSDPSQPKPSKTSEHWGYQPKPGATKAYGKAKKGKL